MATSQEQDFQIALGVAAYLGKLGYTTKMERLDTGCQLLTYTKTGEEHPAIQVSQGTIVIPKGSDFNLIDLILGGP